MRVAGAITRRFTVTELAGVFLFGGVFYAFLEIFYRSYTHWSMVLLGGTCFTVIYYIHLRFYRASLLLRCLLGGSFITLAEFAAGCLLNGYYGLGVWDYSILPLNLFGQISLLFSCLWCLLCGMSLPLIKWLRRKLRRSRRWKQNMII